MADHQHYDLNLLEALSGRSSTLRFKAARIIEWPMAEELPQQGMPKTQFNFTIRLCAFSLRFPSKTSKS